MALNILHMGMAVISNGTMIVAKKSMNKNFLNLNRIFENAYPAKSDDNVPMKTAKTDMMPVLK
jgi:hypothetical protein